MSCIRRSYRIRGTAARTTTNNTKKPPVQADNAIGIKPRGTIGGTRRTLLIKETNKILVYSAIKSNANRPPLYSVLNPDTNSDSPSVRSKGLRCVSANKIVNHAGKTFGNRSAGHTIGANVILEKFKKA